MERSSADGLDVDVGEGGDVAGPRAVASVGSMLVGASVLGTGVESNVEVGVGSNGVEVDVGVGVGLAPNEGSKVVAGIGSFVEANGGRVGASGRSPSIEPVVVVGIVCCSSSNRVD